MRATASACGSVAGSGKDLIGGAEAEGEVVGALEAGAVDDGIVDVAVGYALELVAVWAIVIFWQVMSLLRTGLAMRGSLPSGPGLSLF